MQEQPEVSQAIINKIKLMMNMANRAAGNEVEAANAMEMAMDLLAKYNLDMAVIESALTPGTEVVNEKREKTKLDRSAMYEWQRKLCRAIAEANFCWYWATEHRERHTYLERQRAKQNGYEEEIWRQVKRHFVLGRESNVVAVRIMYDYIVETMADISPYKGGEHMSKGNNSWKEGCVDRLIQRIEQKAYEMNHPRESAKSETKSMGVVLVDYAKKEYAANYDANYGEGAHARAEEMSRKWREEEKNRTPATVEPVKEPTEAEKARQEKANKRWWESYRRKQQREYDKRDHEAYAAGAKAGESISLQDRLSK